MIVIPRGLARSFRNAARKCRADRAAPLPPVLVHLEAGQLTLECSLGEVAIALTIVAESQSNESIGVPMRVLDAVENASAELNAGSVTGTARWSGRDGAKSLVFALESCERSKPSLREVELLAMDPKVLTALDECRRVAGEITGRYAFHRLEVNGKAGTLSATDGKRALIHHDLAWPFAESLLIPIRPVFGVSEIASHREVRVGHTKTHLVIVAGPWTITLAIDTTGRFPDVASVVPKSRSATRLELDSEAVAVLMAALREWPETGESPEAITLDATEGLVVRACAVEGQAAQELPLRPVPRDGTPVRLAVDREHLATALLLDCLRWRLVAGKPFVAEGESRTFLAMTLDAPENAPQPSGTTSTHALVPLSILERSSAVMKPESKRLPVPTEPASPALDSIAEAEAFCVSLSEAASRLTRLVQTLKSMKRPRGTLETAFASLNALGFGSGGGS